MKSPDGQSGLLFFTSTIHGAAAVISGYSRRLPGSVLPAADQSLAPFPFTGRGWKLRSLSHSRTCPGRETILHSRLRMHPIPS
jgi:hypothetical protein